MTRKSVCTMSDLKIIQFQLRKHVSLVLMLGHAMSVMGQSPRPPRPPVVINNNSGGNSGAAAAIGVGTGLAIGLAAKKAKKPPAKVAIANPGKSPQVDALATALVNLNHRKAQVRYESVVVIGRLKAAEGVTPLLDRLRNDKDDNVRKFAAWALAEIGDPAALDYLSKAAQFDDSPQVKESAKLAQQKLMQKIAQANPSAKPVVRTQITTAQPVARIATTATSPPEKPVPGKAVETKAIVPVIPEFKAPSEDASSTLKTLNNGKNTSTKENELILEPPVSKP